jgi:hypothetical protein
VAAIQRTFAHAEQRQIRPGRRLDVEDIHDLELRFVIDAMFGAEVNPGAEASPRADVRQEIAHVAFATAVGEDVGYVAIRDYDIVVHEPSGASPRKVRMISQVDAADGGYHTTEHVGRLHDPLDP